jgi:hypothetical protein
LRHWHYSKMFPIPRVNGTDNYKSLQLWMEVIHNHSPKCNLEYFRFFLISSNFRTRWVERALMNKIVMMNYSSWSSVRDIDTNFLPPWRRRNKQIAMFDSNVQPWKRRIIIAAVIVGAVESVHFSSWSKMHWLNSHLSQSASLANGSESYNDCTAVKFRQCTPGSKWNTPW